MMSFLFLDLTEGWHTVTLRDFPNTSFKSFFTLYNINLMTKRTDFTEVRVIVKMVYPVLIKVRAYTRTRFGKIEKVCSHYRRYWGI